MAAFKFVINDPSTKKSFQKEVDQSKAVSIVGKKIGEQFSGDFIELSGYMLQVTGGTDKDGFPMHPSVKGPVRKRVLLSGPPGFYPRLKGQRKRKTVRGDTLSEDIVQVNLKIVKKGEKALEEVFPQKEKKEEPQQPQPEQKEEKPETKPEPKKEEKKPEREEEKPAEKPQQKEEKKETEKPKTVEKKEEPKQPIEQKKEEKAEAKA